MSEVVSTGEVSMVGRADYGSGFTGELVTIDGDLYVAFRGKYAEPCGKCAPVWSGSVTHYAGIYGGVCFGCNGRGCGKFRTLEELTRLIKRRAADERRRAAKEAQRIAERDVALAQWREANPEVVAMLAEVATDFPAGNVHEMSDNSGYAREKWGGFLYDLSTQAQWRPLSEAQTAAVAEAYDRAKAQQSAQAEKEAASRWYGTVGEKVTAPGTVVVGTSFESKFGYTRLLVIEGGEGFEGVTFKVMGSGKTLWETGRGDTVEVSGAIKDHGEYEGVKQTVLTRAKVKVITKGEE